jgi:hypothetical protein
LGQRLDPAEAGAMKVDAGIFTDLARVPELAGAVEAHE